MNLAAPDAPPVFGRPELGERKLNHWTVAIVIIGILVVGVLFSLIFYSNAQVSTQTFSYSPPRNSQSSYNSLTISNIDGLVTVVPWAQSSILINGTVTAKGLGSSLSAVTITNSSNNGDIVLNANFPVSGGILFSQIYTVNMTVFVPSTIRLGSLNISNENGGVTLNTVNSTSVTVTTTNGDILLNCVYCANVTEFSTNGNVAGTFASLATGGFYNLTATNANINFTAPASSSFMLNAKVLNGYITCQIPNCQSSSKTSLTQIFGTGSARVYLDSVNGQITITGT